MDRGEVIRRLHASAEDLRAGGVAALFLFGSTIRGDAQPESDVDLFFDYADPSFSLIELVRIKRQVEEILGVEADVMTRDSLHPRLKTRIEASAERIF